MAKSIEEKVVKLSMDDKDFTSRAEKSIGVFAKLRQAFSKSDKLSTKKSVAQLDTLNSKTKNMGMDALQSAIETINSRFSTMGIIAATVISNITNKVMNLASTLAKGLTIEPMLEGFSEYELKMGSIQTILANTARHGTTIDEITDSLDELNLYADKTIYNFGDMTRNIGLFTNAGIDVKEATAMIKGFSNEAATSGTNAGQAAGAAYQLSQALSAGTIRLMDWRSLQNVGMGNKNMQIGLVELTEAMGGFLDSNTNATEVQEDFNGSLEHGWLTADIMSNYLQIMAESDEKVNREKMKGLGLSDQQIDSFIKQQKTAEEAATKVRTFSQLLDTAKEALGSGWTETWEIIFGGFYEATELWTSINDKIDPIIAKSAEQRNNFLKDLDKMGAKKLIIEGLGNVFKFVGQMIDTVKGAFAKIFPPASTVDVYLLIKVFRDLTAGLVLTKDEMKQVSTIFEGVFAAISIGIKFVKMIAKAFMGMIPDGLGGSLLDILENIAKLVIEFDKSLTPANVFSEALRVISDVVRNTIDAIRNFGGTIKDVFKAIGAVIPEILGSFSGIGGKIKDTLSKVKLEDILNVVFIGGLISVIKKIRGFIDNIKDSFSSFGDIGDAIKGAIENLGGLTDVLDNMGRVVNIATILSIATSVLMLAFAMRIIADLPAQDIFKGLEVIALALAGVMGALWVISKKNLSGSMKAAATLTAIAFSLLALSGALKIISTLDPDQMGYSLMTLAGMIVLVVGAMAVMSKINGPMFKNAVAISVIAGALLVLSGVVAILGHINTGAAVQGVVALGAILLELAIFLKMVSKTKLNPGTAIAVAIISGAIMGISASVAILGYMDTGALIQGLGAVGAILIGFSLFAKFTGNAGKLMATAISIGILAGAINMMIIPLKVMGGMSMDEISAGLITLAGSLGIMVGALNLAKGTIGGSVALMGAALAIAMFTPSIVILGNLSLGQIATALVGLAGTFGVVAVAALLMGPASAALIPFALAIGAVGLAIGAVGMVILGATAALTALAGLTVAGIASIVGSLSLLVAGLATLIPQFIDFGVKVINGMLQGMEAIAPNLISFLVTVILLLLGAVVAIAPAFVDTGLQIITAILRGIADNVEMLIDAGIDAVIALINGMADGIRDNQDLFISAIKSLIGSIMELLVSGFEEIIVTMFGWIPGVEKTTRGVGDAARKGLRETFAPEDTKDIADKGTKEFTKGVDNNKGGANKAGTAVAKGAKTGLGSQTADKEGKTIGSGFGKGLDTTGTAVLRQGGNVAQKGKSGLGSKNATAEGGKLGTGFNTSLGAKGGAASSAGSSVAQRGKSGLGSVDASSAGSNMGQGFADGISSKWEAVKGAASRLASAGKTALEKVLAIFSPSRVMRKDGQHFGDGFVLGIKDRFKTTAQAGKDLGISAIDGTEELLSSESQRLADILDLAPIIKPILDLSNITRARLGDLTVSGEGGGGIVNHYDITINAPTGDAKALAREVEKIIVRRN